MVESMRSEVHEPAMVPAVPWPLLGQGRAIVALQGAIARGAVVHAYLFAGPDGSGRATLARLFAQTLNCETPEAGVPVRLAPCGDCRSCRKIARGTHPDVQIIGLAAQEAGAGGGGRKDAKHTSLSIDTIRALAADMSLRPMEGRWRVMIVEDAETMREEAANAFLKTLEEPPPFTVLILVVPDPGATLPTIRSRCQVVELRPVPRDELAGALIARGGLAPAQAQALAALARGRAGWAIAAGERPEFLAERDAAVGAMLDLLDGPAVELYPAVDRLVDRFKRGRRDEVRDDLDAWLGLWRDLLLLRAGCEELVSNVAQVERLRPLAARFGLERLREAVDATRDASRWLDENVTPRLALETMVSRWPVTRAAD